MVARWGVAVNATDSLAIGVHRSGRLKPVSIFVQSTVATAFCRCRLQYDLCDMNRVDGRVVWRRDYGGLPLDYSKLVCILRPPPVNVV